MRILPRFVRFAPHPLRPRRSDFRLSRLLLRGLLLIVGYYAAQCGVEAGKARAADLIAYAAAIEEKGNLETEAYLQRCKEDMAEIYRATNSILSYAGLDPIGDEAQ